MLRCPSCLGFETQDYRYLADHMIKETGKSDPDHVMWLNRYLTKERVNAVELEQLLSDFFNADPVREWIIRRVLERFYLGDPNPYIAAMQRPTKYLLLGYAFEHHHFLKQWVRSCSLIVSNTDKEDVQRYEIDNIISEWHGTQKIPAHHELLLKMAESYGIKRSLIYSTEPLPVTENAIRFWDHACRDFSFPEGMAAMHSMELIPSKKIKEYGSRITYFDPAILTDGSISEDSVNFLQEGYNADVGHSETALKLIGKYAAEMNLEQPCKAIALKSLDKFYDYLLARLQRGEMIENQQY